MNKNSSEAGKLHRADSSSELEATPEMSLDRVCPQCESNARWNEAAGYVESAVECRAYCLSGHKINERKISHSDKNAS